MKKDLLNNNDFYYGNIDMPKYFEINRFELKSNILVSFIKDKSLSKDSFTYEFYDYELLHSKALQMLIVYITEHIRLKYNLSIENREFFGNILDKNEQSFSRKFSKKGMDYTMVYAVDVTKNSSSIVFENDDPNKNLNFFQIENNNFILFSSKERFFISKNNSNNLNIFLIVNFKII
jgi:hypothetical protein